MLSLFIFGLLLSLVFSQNAGTNTAETHPSLPIQQCTSKNSCQTQSGSVVIDANWRWVHNVGGSTNCFTGNTWDQTLCPDPATCTKNCALDGADYPGTYGITTQGNALNLKFVTHGPYSTNIGSRLYLLQDDTHYRMFKLKNREFTFTVDISNLPCGLNGALYLVEMDADGGLSEFSTNKCGAKYGTGYCDAQCPHDIKWINGQANNKDWKPSPNDPNSGTGFYGSCCTEMDIWESNSAASAVTPHVCTVTKQTQCSGTQCGDMPDNRYGGVCDKDGCDFNSWRMGNHTFFGPQMTVDTSKPFTVVTQFVTNDGTDRGTLSAIKRIYVQNGVVIQNSMTNFNGLPATNDVTDTFCNNQKSVFGDRNDFEAKGGLRSMGQALDRGLVLVLSLWDDHDVHMLWLDSDYPTASDPSKPGIARGPCSTSSGVPSEVESQYPNANVIYSAIKYGPINSTF
jgi:cellulose 1,4-beta-cellobiosidase